MKALGLKLRYSDFLSIWPRGGAREPLEQLSKNGFCAPPSLTLILRFWPKFDLFWPQKVIIHASSESQWNFHSFKVYVIYIRALGGAQKPFFDNCSRGSRASPRGQIDKKNHCTVTSDQGLSFDIWLINVTSLMTSKVDCNLLSFLMSFFLFQPTQHPPTTIILVSKWSQESCGSFDTLIKKYVDFRPKNYRSRQWKNGIDKMTGLHPIYRPRNPFHVFEITWCTWRTYRGTEFKDFEASWNWNPCREAGSRILWRH